jgi:hypothetical protein
MCRESRVFSYSKFPRVNTAERQNGRKAKGNTAATLENLEKAHLMTHCTPSLRTLEISQFNVA